MSVLTKIAAASLAGCLAVAAVSCKQEGPMEKAGKKADEAVEKSSEKIKEASERDVR